MANQKMYLPPHRRSHFQTELIPRSSLFEGTILGLKHLHLQPPSPSVKTLIESQSVRRGHGRFGAPSESSCTGGRSVIALVSETEHDETTTTGNDTEGHEDLNTASAVYSISTNLARSVITDTASTRAHTPLPTTEWESVILPRFPLPPKPPRTSLPAIPLGLIPPKPRPLAERIWGHIPDPISTRPLIERIGGLYIPPGARSRDDLGFWQSRNTPRVRSKYKNPARDDTAWWQSQSNTIKRQRENIRLSQIGNHPGPSRRSHITPSFSQIAVLFHTLGEKVISIKIDDLKIEKEEGIEGVGYVGCYKWIESGEGPTLAVPAVPDIWDPPEVVGKLTHDKDIKNYEEFPDYASALLPPSLSTLEPLFLSLTSPDVLYDIDLVTGRNNLRKLWSACRATDSHHTSPWRIDIGYLNCGDSSGLVILERFEPPQRQQKTTPSGYRQSYQEATTRKVLDGSDRTPGCNRVIKYSFGGLKMLVKFDTPAFRPSKSNWTEYESGVTELFDTTTNDGVSTMDGLDFDDPVYNGQSIRIRHTNLTPPVQGECLSIKTKSHLDEFDAEYHYPQMYFSQTPHVIYAKHQHGNFKFPIEEYNLFTDPVPGWIREERQEAIDKVAGLLRWIVGLAREYKRGLGLVWDGKEFGVCERDQGGKEVSAPVREMIMDVKRRDRSVVALSVAGELSVQ